MSDQERLGIDPKEATSIISEGIAGRLVEKILKTKPGEAELQKMLAVLRGQIGKDRYNDKQETNLTKAITAIEVTLNMARPENLGMIARAEEAEKAGRTDTRDDRAKNPVEQKPLDEVERKEKARGIAKSFLQEISNEIAMIEREKIEIRHHRDNERIITPAELRENGKKMAEGLSKLFKQDLKITKFLYSEISSREGELMAGSIWSGITRARDFRERYKKVVLKIIEIMSN